MGCQGPHDAFHGLGVGTAADINRQICDRVVGIANLGHGRQRLQRVPAAQQRPRWAFHGFDYGAAFEQWDDMKIAPTVQDLEFGAYMRSVFAAFIYGNSVPDIRTVDSDPAFPTNFVTNVVSIGSGGSVAAVNYKSEQCRMWSRMGLDERFWWIN
jgi:hypothetical protein